MILAIDESVSDINHTQIVESELSVYLFDSAHSLMMLNKYKSVKATLFCQIQYNTHCHLQRETIISICGQIETARRNRLSNTSIEKLLLLKAKAGFTQL